MTLNLVHHSEFGWAVYFTHSPLSGARPFYLRTYGFPDKVSKKFKAGYHSLSGTTECCGAFAYEGEPTQPNGKSFCTECEVEVPRTHWNFTNEYEVDDASWAEIANYLGWGQYEQFTRQVDLIEWVEETISPFVPPQT